MNLKYYLRGLGTGILVTALVLAVSFEVRVTKIKSSYENVPESHSEKQSETASTPKTPETDKQSESQTESTDEVQKDTKATVAEPKTEPKTEPDTTAPKPEASTAMPQSATVTLDIYSGMSSNKVAARLKELGVIEDADEFNNYMYANRAESRIHTGKYEISQNASYEEIVAIITGR